MSRLFNNYQNSEQYTTWYMVFLVMCAFIALC